MWLLIGVIAVLVSASFVYAWAYYESDGGFNVYEGGVCLGSNTNFLYVEDDCVNLHNLKEYYGVEGLDGWCLVETVDCRDYSGTTGLCKTNQYGEGYCERLPN